MMRLGIFGGTFNPIHKGHINASIEFYDRASLDKLLIIPDRVPPHKQNAGVNAAARLEMVQLVYNDKEITKNRSIEVSDIELKRTGKSYTYDTLLEISEIYPGAEIFMFVGSDMYYTLDRWYRGSDILKLCSPVTCARQENEKEQLFKTSEKYKVLYGTESIIMDFTPIVLSSTEIRGLISEIRKENSKKAQDLTKKYLTDSVIRYIMENNLYCESEGLQSKEELSAKIRSELSGFLNEKRLQHTLAVERTALLICSYFVSLGESISENDVVIAALLHDITKNMEQTELCRRYHINVSKEDTEAYETLHAKTGAYFARERYDISEEVFSAIDAHTLGNTNMSLLDKIIFVADYCEETRVHESCKESRVQLLDIISTVKEKEQAYLRLDLLLCDILAKTVQYNYEKGVRVHSRTLESLKALVEKHKSDERFLIIYRSIKELFN